VIKEYMCVTLSNLASADGFCPMSSTIVARQRGSGNFFVDIDIVGGLQCRVNYVMGLESILMSFSVTIQHKRNEKVSFGFEEVSQNFATL
jgi:hypothetical protein